jgi:filamentous hemagglutinin
MFGIKRETLAELVEYCESLDPGVQAYAKAALAARIFADLPAADRAQLKSITKWDIESVSGLSYDTVLMLELANEALHCQAPSCKNTKNQTVLKLYNTIGQKELHLATFLKMTPPSESSLGFDTTGMTWSQYITVLQAEELIAQAGGTIAGHAVAKGGSFVAARLGAQVAGRFAKHASNTATISGKTCVYSCQVDGVTRYVGITDDIVKRGQAHMREKGIVIDQIPGMANLSRADARAVEQVLINLYGLGKNGGSLINKINSISKVNKTTRYEQALVRGAELLRQQRYPGF